MFYVNLTIDNHYCACVSLSEYFFMLDTECVFVEVAAEILGTIHIDVTLQRVTSLLLKTV